MNENIIPRIETEEVRSILMEKTTRKDKAVKIYRYHYDLCCRETDGRLPAMMDANRIEELLKMQGY